MTPYIEYDFGEPEFTEAVGEPCYDEDATPAKLTWNVKITGKDASTTAAQRFNWSTYYQVKLSDVIEEGTEMSSKVETTLNPQDGSEELQESLTRSANSTANLRILPGSAQATATKSVDEKLVRTSDRVNWNLKFANTGTGGASAAEWIDVLPYDGDDRDAVLKSATAKESASLSDIRVENPVWESTSEEIDAPTDVDVRIAVTDADPNEIVADPADESNGDNGDTEWCWVTAETACDEVLENATAVRIAADELPAYSRLVVSFSASTYGVRDGAQLVNNVGKGRVEDLTLEVPETNKVTTSVYDLLFDGFIWHDANADGSYQEDENLLEGASVTILDANGEEVATAQTSSDGYYWFGQGATSGEAPQVPGIGADEPYFLPDGEYTIRVTKDGEVIGEGWSFTYSGKNEELNGDSTVRELGRASDEETEFSKHERANFGVVAPEPEPEPEPSDEETPTDEPEPSPSDDPSPSDEPSPSDDETQPRIPHLRMRKLRLMSRNHQLLRILPKLR